MTVTVNPERHIVTIKGDRFEVDLGWSQALLLGTLLKEASIEAEPSAPVGRTYEPVSGRWG